MRPVLAGIFLLAFSIPAGAGVIFYTTSPQFGIATSGMNAMSTENWESGSNVSGIILMNDPLQSGVSNGPFASGSAAGIQVQSNSLGSGAANTSPSGASALAYAIAGTLGVSGNPQPSKQVSANLAGNSFDIILSTVGGNTPLAIDMSPTFYRVLGASNSGTLTVTVFSSSNTLLGSTTVNNVADALESAYIGIVATGADDLGRINIWANAQDVAGADNLRVFGTASASTPEPSTMLMTAVGLAGLVLARRRRIN